ncbi:hypothetical protein, partial [Sphingopyxis sp.]|uniref:hypothetical protein n=1 Tax=Sphingopyxis sp. TaxID=1908224 RepID=UPI002B46000F
GRSVGWAAPMPPMPPTRGGGAGRRRCLFRVRTYQLRVRGLKRFCSVRGGKAQEYVDISRLADEAMDKIGQIPPPA